MPDALLIQVADAVVAALNEAAGLLPEGVTAERSYGDWDMLLSDDDTLKVDVVPSTWTTTQGTRGERRYECSVSIGVRKRFGVDDQEEATGRLKNTEVDSCVLLLQQLADHFVPCDPSQDGSLANLPDAVIDPDKGVEILPPYAPNHLREMRQYTGIAKVNFIVYRAVA